MYNRMRFQLYVPKTYVIDLDIFVKANGRCSSRVLCDMMRQFNEMNIKVDIPALRKVMNDENLRKLKELIAEYD